MTKWEFTYHALKRGVEMCLTAEEILDALNHPGSRHRNRKPIKGRAQWVYVKNRLIVIVADDGHTVITILWRDRDKTPSREDRADYLARVRDRQAA